MLTLDTLPWPDIGQPANKITLEDDLQFFENLHNKDDGARWINDKPIMACDETVVIAKGTMIRLTQLADYGRLIVLANGIAVESYRY